MLEYKYDFSLGSIFGLGSIRILSLRGYIEPELTCNPASKVFSSLKQNVTKLKNLICFCALYTTPGYRARVSGKEFPEAIFPR